MKGTELLQEEHRTIARVTRVLAEMLQNGKKVPAPVLQNVVQFLHIFGDDYHQEQEGSLFALLQIRGFPPEEFPVESLKHDHDKLVSLTNRLENAVAVYCVNDPVPNTILVSTLHALAELYSDQVWKENYVLLPIAEELFSAADQLVLADTLQMVRAEKWEDAQRVVEQLSNSIRQCPECS